MELNLDEQNLIAAFRRLEPKGREELLRFAATLSRSSNTGAEDDSSSGSCKLAREEERPEIAAEPLCTE